MTQSYINTTQKVKLTVGGADFSLNLISGTVTDSDFSTNNVIYTSGSIDLGGDFNGQSILDYNFRLGQRVLITSVFGDRSALHPRGTLFVISHQQNFNDKTVTLEVACRLTILKDYGTNNNSQIRTFIEKLKEKEKDLTLCDIKTFDISALEAIAEATGYAAYMDGADNLKLTPRINLRGHGQFTSYLDKSAISVEDLNTVLIPPSSIKLEQEFETPGYPEEDPEDKDDEKIPCLKTSTCPEGNLCVDGICLELECTLDSHCPPYAECVDGNCEEITCNDEKINAIRQRIRAEMDRLDFLAPESDAYSAIEHRVEILSTKLRKAMDSTTCPEGTICVNGKCDDGYCQEDIDCEENYFCVDGQCSQLSCFDTPDCPPGYSCFNGVCKLGECFVDKDCRTRNGGECVDGECIVFECSEDADCSEGYTCIDRECQRLPDLCSADSDCEEGEVCIRGQCVPEEGCVEDSDCSKGFTCVDGNCQEVPDEEEEEDPIPDEVLSDVTNVISTALRARPFNELFVIKRGKFFKEEEDRTLIHSCGKHINPLFITARAQQSANQGNAACTTQIPDKGTQGGQDEYVFAVEGQFEFEDVYFEDKIIKREEVTYNGPGKQQDYEKTYEIMSAWRSNDSNIRTFLDTYVQQLSKLTEEANQIGEEVSEYMQMRDENDKDNLDVLQSCLDQKTKLMLDKAFGFYECLAANAQIRFSKRINKIINLYNEIKAVCESFAGHRVTTNIEETSRTFGESGEVLKQTKHSYVHGGASKVVTDYIKNFGVIDFKYNGQTQVYAIGASIDPRIFWATPAQIDTNAMGIPGYEVEYKKASTIDFYEYYVGHVKHTNRKIDNDNPLNNTTQIVISTDNSTAAEAPPSQRSYLEQLDTDLDGIPNIEDEDDDNDGILDGADPDPLIPNKDTDADGIADENDDDIDGDEVPNDLDPSPYRDDSNGPDRDGDGIPNIRDPDVDGDGFSNDEDPDIDGDGIPNDRDSDSDGDGYSNSSDPDADGDQILDTEDPNVNNPTDDMDGDGIPDATDDDIDGDGLANSEDPSPTVVDYDTDGDGLYDFEDNDDDGDGIGDGADPNPLVPELDLDQDGVVDLLDPDIDGDGILNADDPMPDFPNTRDIDGDGILDVIDPDMDGDGLTNDDDPRPTVPDEDIDLDDIDGDGIPNDEDSDADGDGVPSYADMDDLDPDAQFEPGKELTPCKLTTENYTIEMNITIKGNSESIAGVTVGGEETISFPLDFLPLIPENMTAQIEDEAGDAMWMASQTCNDLSLQFQLVAETRLERIERLMAKYFKYYTERLVMSGNSIRVVESMRPELYSWKPGLNVRVVNKGRSQGNYYVASTTWGFDPSNMIVSMDLIGD